MWNSVDDLVSELGLPASSDDLDAVEKAVKEQLTLVHPDKTNGTFKSEGQKARCESLNAALEFIQGQRHGPLALRDAEVSALLEAVLALQRKAEQPKHTRPEVMKSVRVELRRTSRFPKVTSGGLFAISTIAFGLIGTSSTHPLLGALNQYPWALRSLCVFWALSGFAFILVWLRERADEQEVQHRLSEESVKDAFHRACSHAARNPDGRFSRSDILSDLLPYKLSPFLRRRHGSKVKASDWARWLRELLVPMKVGHHAADEIASFYLARWFERGAIRRSAYADSEEWFEVDERVLERHS